MADVVKIPFHVVLEDIPVSPVHVIHFLHGRFYIIHGQEGAFPRLTGHVICIQLRYKYRLHIFFDKPLFNDPVNVHGCIDCPLGMVNLKREIPSHIPIPVGNPVGRHGKLFCAFPLKQICFLGKMFCFYPVFI